MKKVKILAPSDWLNKMKVYFKRSDLIVLLTVFITTFLSEINYLIGEGVAHDGLVNGGDGFTYFAGQWEASLGRFLLHFVDYARFGIFAKSVVLIFCALYMSLAVMLITRIFKIKNKFQVFFLSLLVALAPYFSEIYMFRFCADSYLLAFLFAVLAVYFLDKKNKKGTILAALFTMLTAGLYQAFLGVVCGLTVLLVIRNILDGNNIWGEVKGFIKNCLTIICGLIIYFVLMKIYNAISGVEMASYVGINTFGTESLSKIPLGIKNAIKDFRRFYQSGNGFYPNNYYYRGIVYRISFVLFAISCVVIIKDLKKDRWKKTLALIIFVLFLPIGATITDVIIPGSREYPYMAAGQITMIVAAFMVWQHMNKKNFANLLRYGEVGLMIFLAWTYFLSETYMQELRNHTWERFDHFASDVVTRVELNDDYKDDMPWMISHELGSMNIDWYKGGQVSTQGMSKPNFKGLSEYTKYFSKYLGFEYEPVDKETYDKIKETKEFKEMTVYPKKNSVKIIDGVVVVKTSEDVY